MSELEVLSKTALEASANGYVVKVHPEALFDALSRVLAGEEVVVVR